MENLILRLANQVDCQELAVLSQNLLVDSWTTDNFSKELEKEHSYTLVALIDSKIVGFITGNVFNSFYINSIGVNKDFQNKSIATKLLTETAIFCKKNIVDTMTLDVRESNETAIAFYKKNIFSIVHVSNNTYTNPKENACLMERVL